MHVSSGRWLLGLLLALTTALLWGILPIKLKEVLRVCQESKTLSEAGRRLFAISRLAKTSSNDADRLARYLARFSLRFNELHSK